MAIKDGLIDKDSVNLSDMKKYRATLAEYMRDKGYRPQAELFRQLFNQKILRAVYSNNQVQEVLTDFASTILTFRSPKVAVLNISRLMKEM